MKSMKFLSISAFLFLTASPSFTARAAVVGDPAPDFNPGRFVQGVPVTKLEKDKLYIVEFWATWCGPCRASIPHLNALWQKYQDKIIVIGQDVWDQDSEVPGFIKKMGTNMTYRVALDNKADDKDGFMSEHWWKRGVEHHGIPHAYIIKDGRVAWMGHPMALNEETLDKILSPNFNFTKAAAQYQQEQEKTAQLQETDDRMMKAVGQGNWDAAASQLQKLESLDANADNLFVTYHFRILLGQKKFDEAYSLAKASCDKNKNNSTTLNEFAWIIVAQKNVEKRDLDLAENLANQASALEKYKNPDLLDTLARAQFMKGEKDLALATEQKAVNLTQGNSQEELRKTLRSYEAGQLPEVSL